MPDLPQDPVAQLEGEVRRLREESAKLMRALEETKRQVDELRRDAKAKASLSEQRP